MAGAATPWWGQSTHTLGFFVDEPHRIIPTLFVQHYRSRRHSCYRSRGAGVEVLTGVRSAAQTPETDRPTHSAEPRRARSQPPRASTGPKPMPYHIVRRSSNPFLRLFYEDTATRRILPHQGTAPRAMAGLTKVMRSPTSPSPPKPDTTPARPPSHAPPHWRRMVGSSMPDANTGVVGDHATTVNSPPWRA